MLYKYPLSYWNLPQAKIFQWTKLMKKMSPALDKIKVASAIFTEIGKMLVNVPNKEI